MIKYDLHSLGWHDFQQLCLTIVREILGQTVSTFLDTNDAGMDGAFSGAWKQKNDEDLEGKFIIQCKFTNKADNNLRLSDLKDEFEKIKKLILEERCDCYILITNAGVSGQLDVKFGEKLSALGVKRWRIFGSTWIFNQITESNVLRAMVPRIYGLGDLSQILDHRAYSQAKQLLASMRDDLSKIVITSSYYNAAKAMDEHGFVLIIGEPAAGKTTIASLLAMAGIDRWKLETIKVNTPDSILKHWNPEDPNQFFWIDDAFGVTQYESNLVNKWNHILPQINSMLKQGVKIVMTSRDYIYKRARNDLKEGAFPLFKESQVVIDLHELTTEEKQKILYNHLKLGHQPKSFLKRIKPYLVDVANNKRFIPESARRLSSPTFTSNLHISKDELAEFVEKQESFLDEVIRGLDKESKAALGLIYMSSGQLSSPIDLQENEIKAVGRMGSDVGSCLLALESMKDTLVQYICIDDENLWRFKHPTIGDAYARIITQSSELLEIFLRGAGVEKLLEQITCGDVGLEKTIIVPPKMYDIVLDRMLSFNESDAYKTDYLSEWDAQRKLLTFLSRRSSKKFLKLFVSVRPEIFKIIIKPNMYFYYSKEIDTVVKLHEFGLMPEKYRKEFVEYITNCAISGDDLYILRDEDMQTVFSEEELKDLKLKIKMILIPKLSEVRTKDQYNFKDDDIYSPQEHMEEFFTKIDILQDEFSEENSISELLEKEEEEAKNWVEETYYENTEKPNRKLSLRNDNNLVQTSRNIFDDIDE
ncbi:nSTAND3 domain-containing NTPase [Chryseobacterium gleum]|uniref:nSTAND3 domain-containing NTPase n=1 Tax=Chryseobacterium gleum TaxID=250 RepID=UPI0028AA5C73|nr:restriction endonuclease [Chryseobacterium gleum]